MSIKKQGSSMKKTVSFIVLLLAHCSFIFAGNAQSTSPNPDTLLAPQPQTIIVEGAGLPTGGDVHIHNHNHNNFHPSAHNANVSSNNQESTNVNTNTAAAFAHAAAQATSKLYAKIRARIDPHMEQIQNLSTADCTAWIRLNKKQLILGTIAIVYSGTSAALIRGNHYVNQSSLWANWKSHMTAQEMQACPQHELQNSLIEEILKRYLSKSPNRLACYLQFAKDVEEEERRFAQHIMLARIVRKSMLMRFFPINDQKIKRARSKQKRLAFIKHIFISWAAQQPRLK